MKRRTILGALAFLSGLLWAAFGQASSPNIAFFFGVFAGVFMLTFANDLGSKDDD